MKSWRISSTRRGKIFLWAGLGILTLAACVLSLALGSVNLGPGTVIRSLLSGDTASTAGRIVWYVRLPRLCAGLLAGAALAVSGTVIQTVLHNPLASPGVIGVNSSAGLAVALVCAMAPAAQALSPLAAFLGALAGVGRSEAPTSALQSPLHDQNKYQQQHKKKKKKTQKNKTLDP